MALRTFLAPDGTSWRVWQVTPAAVVQGGPDRRTRERRGQDVLLYKGPERRAAERRRRAPGGAALGLSGGLERGWLAFEEAGGKKRRLCPPPAGWEELPEAELVGLLQRAAPVAVLRPQES